MEETLPKIAALMRAENEKDMKSKRNQYFSSVLFDHVTGTKLQEQEQMNNFEHVSNDHLQMSLVGRRGRSPGLMSGRGRGRSPGLMFQRVPYHVPYPMMHLILCTPLHRGQTHACENITFPQLRLRAVIRRYAWWLPDDYFLVSSIYLSVFMKLSG